MCRIYEWTSKLLLANLADYYIIYFRTSKLRAIIFNAEFCPEKE